MERLARVQGHLAPQQAQQAHQAELPAPVPAAGVLSWLGGLFGGGDADVSEGDAAGAAGLGAVTGTVRGCFVAATAEELTDEYEGGILPDDAHFQRRPVGQIAADAANWGPDSNYPPSHQGFALTLADPNERALLCSTAEGYEKLAEGLPQYSEHFGAGRPGSGEQLHVDGLEQWSLCIGDVFRVGSGGTQLQVTSPRRPCDKWNMTHNQTDPTHRLGDADDTIDGNVRHYCLTHTLGGIFFRVIEDGPIAVNDTLTLMERPHPDWPLKRVGDLLYSEAEVHPDTFMKGGAWSGTTEELDELLGMELLATCEWKEVMQMAKGGLI